MRYLDPKTDLTFKKVFGEHPHLLISLLNALLPLPEGRRVESIEYLPAELAPRTPLQKNSIVDVRCRDNTGRQFIVEMQMIWTPSFEGRVVFNAAKAFVKQLNKGDMYEYLQPVYTLGLVNDTFMHDTPEYYHHYSIIHNTMTDKKIDGLEFVMVELPKFKARNLTERRIQVLWLRFLTEVNEKTEHLPVELTENPEVREAMEILRESAFTPEELTAYENYWDYVSTERTIRGDSLREGLKIGMEKGEQIGMEKGEQIGLRMAAKIIRLHSSGKTMDEMAHETGLPTATIMEVLREAGMQTDEG